MAGRRGEGGRLEGGRARWAGERDAEMPCHTICAEQTDEKSASSRNYAKGSNQCNTFQDSSRRRAGTLKVLNVMRLTL